MVSRLRSYCNPLKRKGAAVDTGTDAPTKRVRITLMKQLAKKYKKSKINKVNVQ